MVEKFGFFQVYNEYEWVGYQIDDSMRLCDKILITEGSQFAGFSDISERSNDGTLDIIHDKMKEYPNRIQLNYTIRKHDNYRRNQAANFNRALVVCGNNKYFIPIDADEFWFDKKIDEVKEILDTDKYDLIKILGIDFAFSFKWQLLIKNNPLKRSFIYKTNPNMHFVPTHQHRNVGPKQIETKGIFFHHYKWVKQIERMRIRHETSNFVPGMMEWFNKNWDKIELKNATYNFYLGKFKLKKFNGKHPEILDNHPWKDVEDVRRL